MSQLSTYFRSFGDIVQLNGDTPTEPGQLVYYFARPSSTLGIIVAIDETSVCVLWSKEPADFMPCIPLQVTPSRYIFDPTSFTISTDAHYS